MSDDTTAITAIPRALESYPSGADQTLAAVSKYRFVVGYRLLDVYDDPNRA